MTPEQRLNRLERIALLFVKAGLRERSRTREHGWKIEAILNAQILNEDRFARLAGSLDRLAESQAQSDKRLDALVDIIRQRNEGNSHSQS